MDLFSNDEIINLLPYDGVVNYHGRVMSAEAALNYANVLMDTIAWKNDEAVIFGKHIITKRKAPGMATMATYTPIPILQKKR